MTSSLWPIHWGLYCTTLSFVMATCVGNSRLPELHRLARNTSPVVNGRPLLTTTHARSTTTPSTTAPAIHTHVWSAATLKMLSYFCRGDVVFGACAACGTSLA